MHTSGYPRWLPIRLNNFSLMINLRGSELPGLLGLEYCPRSGLVGISHIHCGWGYSIVPDTRWPGLAWSDLFWSNLVWSNAASGFEGIYCNRCWCRSNNNGENTIWCQNVWYGYDPGINFQFDFNHSVLYVITLFNIGITRIHLFNNKFK